MEGTKGGYVGFHVCLVELRIKASANSTQLHDPTTSDGRYTELFPGLAGNCRSLKLGRLVALELKASWKCCEGYMGLQRL